MKHNNNTYDVIVVGSGAGGATIAREMSRRHKKVLLLEQGGKTRSLGNTMTVAMSLSRLGLLRRQCFSGSPGSAHHLDHRLLG